MFEDSVVGGEVFCAFAVGQAQLLRFDQAGGGDSEAPVVEWFDDVGYDNAVMQGFGDLAESLHGAVFASESDGFTKKQS